MLSKEELKKRNLKAVKLGDIPDGYWYHVPVNFLSYFTYDVENFRRKRNGNKEVSVVDTELDPILDVRDYPNATVYVPVWFVI